MNWKRLLLIFLRFPKRSDKSDSLEQNLVILHLSDRLEKFLVENCECPLVLK